MHLVPLFCLFIFCFLLIEWSEVPAFPHECNGISVPTTLSLLSSTQHNSVPARLSIWIDFIDHSVLDLAKENKLAMSVSDSDSSSHGTDYKFFLQTSRDRKLPSTYLPNIFPLLFWRKLMLQRTNCYSEFEISFSFRSYLSEL